MSSTRPPEVVIIGAGMSGLCMGIELQQAGIPFVILEKSPRLGGTWWENTYPGCACDVPSHLYAFSFAPKPDWSRVYPNQPEILRYLEQLTDDRGLLEHIRFGVEVRSARYREDDCRWDVELDDGEVIDAATLVSAVGALHRPKLPDLAGLGAFEGDSFHSAKWDHDVDLRGKRIGVIGNAASAVQFVPEIAADAKELYVFQRSAHWILPRFDGEYPGWAKRLFRSATWQRLYRTLIYVWMETMFFLVFRKGALMGRLFQWGLTRRLETEITDPTTRAAVLPDYTLGCKRVLLSNDYYPALNRENVRVVTDPLIEETPRGLLTDREDIELDAIIYATGFDPMGIGALKVHGRGGQELSERWARSPRAHLGVTVPGFPNLYVLLGPNTGLGHNSVMWMVECQVDYVMRCMRAQRRHGLRSLEVKETALASYYDQLGRRLENKVWSDCQSWYLRHDGLNFALWPSSTVRYWWETRSPRISDFHAVR